MTYVNHEAHKLTQGWQCEARVKSRAYNNLAERSAYRAGYSDGFHAYPKTNEDREWLSNAYSAGYWEGFADGQD